MYGSTKRNEIGTGNRLVLEEKVVGRATFLMKVQTGSYRGGENIAKSVIALPLGHISKSF
jgi:hypothetical protein